MPGRPRRGSKERKTNGTDWFPAAWPPGGSCEVGRSEAQGLSQEAGNARTR